MYFISVIQQRFGDFPTISGKRFWGFPYNFGKKIWGFPIFFVFLHQNFNMSQ